MNRMDRLFRADPARRSEIVRLLESRLAGDASLLFAYLYGSFHDRPDMGFHDIDVAVSLSAQQRGRETDAALALASDLSALAGFPVDVRVLECAPVTFRFHALHGRLLACRDEPTLTAMLEDTMRRYFDLAPVLHRAGAEAFAG